MVAVPSRHAGLSALVGFSYVVNVAALLVEGQKLAEISRRALRVLGFFAALNRTGRRGYLGTCVTIEQLGEAISRATGEPCKRSTCAAGLRELVEAGYLVVDYVAPWGAEAIQVGIDRWVRRRIAVYTLTDQALALWGRASGVVCDKRLPIQKMDAINPMKGCLSNTLPQGGAGAGRVPGSGLHVQQTALDRAAKVPPTSGGDGSTCPRSVAGNSQEDRNPQGSGQSWGCSVVPPSSGARGDRSWAAARARLLRDLWYYLRPMSRDYADLLWDRAVVESGPKGRLDFLVLRWLSLSAVERRYHLRAEVLPLLRARSGPSAGLSFGIIEYEPCDPPVAYVPTGDKRAAVVGGGAVVGGLKAPPLAPSLVALLRGMAARAEAIDPDLSEMIRSSLAEVKKNHEKATKEGDK